MRYICSKCFKILESATPWGGLTGNSLDSHRFIIWAGETAGSKKQNQLVEELFLNYFSQVCACAETKAEEKGYGESVVTMVYFVGGWMSREHLPDVALAHAILGEHVLAGLVLMRHTMRHAGSQMRFIVP